MTITLPNERIPAYNRFIETAASYFEPEDPLSVSDWCAENVMFNEPGKTLYYKLDGREYIREPLDSFKDWRIRDLVLVFGSQTGKTAMLMAAMAWMVKMRNIRALWVMPSTNIARSFSDTRWSRLIMASPALKNLVSDRYDVTKSQQKLGGSIIDFVGAFSEGALSSNPCDVTILDETDKFPSAIGQEGDAVNLAKQRTKDAPNPKHVCTSTPSVPEGLVWQEFMKGDQRRYFMPCIHCGKDVLFAWSTNYYTFPKRGCEAYVKWSPDAKRSNDTWDLEEVARTAHFECPYCHGSIFDKEKKIMISRGGWAPTASGAAKDFRSYHLSSLYANSPSCSISALAKKFLQNKRSLQGLQTVVNGDFAEPWIAQDDSTKTEWIVSQDCPLTDGKWVRFLTIDCQETVPHFYWICRTWNNSGDSRLIEHGYCDEYEQLAAVQKRLGVDDNCVGIDCGYDPQAVYNACADHAKIVTRPYDPRYPYRQTRIVRGWQPMKGFGEKKVFYDSKRNPTVIGWGEGRMPHKDFGIQILEFNSGDLKDILKRLRERKTKERWEITSEWDTDEYRLHLISETKKRVTSLGLSSYRWLKRSNNWPNHWLDCEVMSLALAVRFGVLKTTETTDFLENSNNNENK